LDEADESNAADDDGREAWFVCGRISNAWPTRPPTSTRSFEASSKPSANGGSSTRRRSRDRPVRRVDEGRIRG
jgi:hypothetical protein